MLMVPIGHVRVLIAVLVLVAGGLRLAARRDDFLLGTEIDILVGIAEDVAVQMGQAGVALDDILELAVADLLAKLLADQTEEVVEAVAVHQRLDLVDEDLVEGFTQQTARLMDFGQTAEPGVDLVEASCLRLASSLVA